MPIYEFVCPDGHHTDILLTWEEWRELEDGAQRDCEVCGDPLARVFPTSSPATARFKGEGFHKNDYDSYGPKKQ